MKMKKDKNLERKEIKNTPAEIISPNCVFIGKIFCACPQSHSDMAQLSPFSQILEKQQLNIFSNQPTLFHENCTTFIVEFCRESFEKIVS